jgi:hypothetical protein
MSATPKKPVPPTAAALLSRVLRMPEEKVTSLAWKWGLRKEEAAPAFRLGLAILADDREKTAQLLATHPALAHTPCVSVAMQKALAPGMNTPKWVLPPLLAAMEAGTLSSFAALLESPAVQVDHVFAVDPAHECTALGWAVKTCHETTARAKKAPAHWLPMIQDLVLAGANALQSNREGDSAFSYMLATVLSMVFYGKVIQTPSGIAGAETNLAIMESFFAAGPVSVPAGASAAESAWLLLYSGSFWTHSAPPELQKIVNAKTGLSDMSTQEMMMVWMLGMGLDFPVVTRVLEKKAPQVLAFHERLVLESVVQPGSRPTSVPVRRL